MTGSIRRRWEGLARLGREQRHLIPVQMTACGQGLSIGAGVPDLRHGYSALVDPLGKLNGRSTMMSADSEESGRRAMAKCFRTDAQPLCTMPIPMGNRNKNIL